MLTRCSSRPGFYAENLLLYAPQAQNEGTLPLPIGETHSFPPMALGVSSLFLRVICNNNHTNCSILGPRSSRRPRPDRKGQEWLQRQAPWTVDGPDWYDKFPSTESVCNASELTNPQALSSALEKSSPAMLPRASRRNWSLRTSQSMSYLRSPHLPNLSR